MNPNISLGRIAGVRIGVNWSWLVVFALIAYTLAASVFPAQNESLSSVTYVAMALAGTLLFFGSLLLHELGHAVQARRDGVEIEGITLWLFGGVARFRGMFPSAAAELRIASAGPLVSLSVGVALLGLAAASHFPDAVESVVVWLGSVNLVLLVFNLLPALPLDTEERVGEPARPRQHVVARPDPCRLRRRAAHRRARRARPRRRRPSARARRRPALRTPLGERPRACAPTSGQPGATVTGCLSGFLAPEWVAGAPLFRDRSDAGRQLARELTRALPKAHPVVVGLARGGVQVAAEVARELRAPLDAVAVRKIGHPQQPEYGLGAVAPGGTVFLRAADGLTASEIRAAVERSLAAAVELDLRLHATRPALELTGRIAVLVDDGLATGATMVAALRWARRRGAIQTIAAVPVAARDSAELIRSEADAFVCPHEVRDFGAVGLWYEEFTQVSDAEVLRLLDAVGLSAGHSPPRSN